MPRINISTKELNGEYISVDDLSLELNCNKDKIFSILHYIKANIYYIGKNRFISNNDIDIIKSYTKMYSVKEASIICFGIVDYNRLKRARISMNIGREVSFFTEDADVAEIFALFQQSLIRLQPVPATPEIKASYFALPLNTTSPLFVQVFNSPFLLQPTIPPK